MSSRRKKLLGLFILLPAIAAYCIAAAALSEHLPEFWLIKLLYFAVAGVAWALPARIMIVWMNADPKPPAQARSATDDSRKRSHNLSAIGQHDD